MFCVSEQIHILLLVLLRMTAQTVISFLHWTSASGRSESFISSVLRSVSLLFVRMFSITCNFDIVKYKHMVILMLQICLTDGERQWSAGITQIPFFDNAHKGDFYLSSMILSGLKQISVRFYI